MTPNRSKIETELRSTRTVYSLRFPETEKVFREMMTSDLDVIEARHREAWTKKQDSYHRNFFDTWERWMSDAEMRDLHAFITEDLDYKYPSAGSSEAIREVLATLGSAANYRPATGGVAIHVFTGEYEGYEALAKPYGLRVVKHDRDIYEESIQAYAEYHDLRGDVFFLSQPSSIDGNVWEGFYDFLQFMNDTPLRVALDLCYVGSVPSSKWFNEKGHPKFGMVLYDSVNCIDYVFFSLSKVFGVYYNRIGGVYSRHPIPGLWGNMWFKNLDSLYFGQKLMETYSLFEIPDKYEDVAKACVKDLQSEAALQFKHLHKSDVLLLAHSTDQAATQNFSSLPDTSQVFCRGIVLNFEPARWPETSSPYCTLSRYCLTQRIHDAIFPKTTT